MLKPLKSAKTAKKKCLNRLKSPTFLHSCIPTFLYSYIATFLYCCIPTFLHSYIPSFYHSIIPSSLISLIIITQPLGGDGQANKHTKIVISRHSPQFLGLCENLSRMCAARCDRGPWVTHLWVIPWKSTKKKYDNFLFWILEQKSLKKWYFSIKYILFIFNHF